MFWKKESVIFNSQGELGWNLSHAQVPTPILIDEFTLRIFYSARNEKNQSLTSYIDVNPNNPNEILYVHPVPILPLGTSGTFDDSGIMPSWAVYNGSHIYLYYIGWNVRNTVPYYNSIGLAISEDGRNFRRFSEGPLWDRNYMEPYFSASTCVIYENGRWLNWYLSCTEYRKIDDKYEPRYHIKMAESKDGIAWDRKGVVAIDYSHNEEAGIVKASVIKEDIFRMWYSYRNFKDFRFDKSNSYKIGYAESMDGINWLRKDNKAGIATSEVGWDSEMQAYPHVINIKGKKIMFYNGNSFGKSGFGYATWNDN